MDPTLTSEEHSSFNKTLKQLRVKEREDCYRRHEAVGRLVFGAGLFGLRAEGRREGAGEAAQDRRLRPRRRADPGGRGRRARLGLPGAFRTAGRFLRVESKILKQAIHKWCAKGFTSWDPISPDLQYLPPVNADIIY